LLLIICFPAILHPAGKGCFSTLAVDEDFFSIDQIVL